MPGAPAVNWNVWPCPNALESKVWPSSADTVCCTSSLLVHVTVVPLATLRLGGTNAKFLMLTASPPVGGSGPVAGRSLKHPAPAPTSTASPTADRRNIPARGTSEAGRRRGPICLLHDDRTGHSRAVHLALVVIGAGLGEGEAVDHAVPRQNLAAGKSRRADRLHAVRGGPRGGPGPGDRLPDRDGVHRGIGGAVVAALELDVADDHRAHGTAARAVAVARTAGPGTGGAAGAPDGRGGEASQDPGAKDTHATSSGGYRAALVKADLPDAPRWLTLSVITDLVKTLVVTGVRVGLTSCFTAHRFSHPRAV